MTLQCDQWSIDPSGVISCLGQAAQSAPLLPPITESEAYMLITAIAGVFVSVFAVRVLRRVIR